MTQAEFIHAPSLKSKQIQIRAIQDSDFDTLYRIAADPLLWEQHPIKNRGDLAEFTKWFKQALKQQAMSIIDTEQDRLIGTTRFYDIEADKNLTFLGYTFIDRQYWGSGANSISKKLLLNHAFQHFDQVCFHIAKINLRSQKAIGKLGASFVKEGMHTGFPYHWYSLSKNDYTFSDEG